MNRVRALPGGAAIASSAVLGAAVGQAPVAAAIEVLALSICVPLRGNSRRAGRPVGNR